jgi:phosphoribosylformimino-5-aminoimidazole carboxamide ribotide isomerase
MDSSTIFHDDPAAQARQWEDMGAPRIHVVDLDGSVAGKPLNLASVKRIVSAVTVPVQLGGGIRDAATISLYLEAGIRTVILGTIAARDPDRVKNFIASFPGRVAVGVDAKAGMVAVEGWTQATSTSAAQLANLYDSTRPVCFIYTDIDRDGMMRGPNIEATREFARSTSVPVILSGGVTSREDVEAILPLEEEGVTGVIIGRALYEGTIKLREVLKIADKSHVS